MNDSAQLRRLEEIYAAIRPDLDRVEQMIRENLRSAFPAIEGMVEHMNRFAGKRIRPALLLLSARAAGRVQDLHLPLGAAVEMLHSATLVHDDVLDGALLRRKIPTIHQVWENEQAVIFGDFVFARTFTLVARLNRPEIFRVFAETADRICTGELLQLANRYRPELDEREYLRIIELKTASLFELSCRLGAMAAGGTERLCRCLGEFGRMIGIAFQIVDDCLDLVGQENVMGKSLGTDIAKGKVTLPLIRLLAALPREEADDLRRIIREDALAASHRERIANWIRRDGVLDGCRLTAESYARRARALLSAVGGPAVQALHDAADFIAARLG